jgi:DNA-binding MarR family transcriptional regulator
MVATDREMDGAKKRLRKNLVRCIKVDVNGLELFLLGRRLMKLGEEAIPPSGFHRMPTSVRSVLVDVYEHPGSSVSEITERTGFPQSHVSASVTRLREAGALITVTDPADRRHTLVSPNPEVRRGLPAMETEWTSVEDVLARAIGSGDPGQAAQAVAALELLARLLTSDAPATLPAPGGP